MLQDAVLILLKETSSPLSGEAMSRTLGVSRAAIWKVMEALRASGYEISSAPNRGYRLESSPDRISAGELAGALAGRRLGREMVFLDEVDSTNSEVKRRALEGAAEGLVVLADCQTGGRGRRGRTFSSPPGKGLYLTALLRPSCTLDELMWLTAWTAVAVCDGIERACGVRPGIKWTNDIVLHGKKLCGILTELGLEGESAAIQYVAVGAGINVGQDEADFGPDVAPVAISLVQAAESGDMRLPRRAELAAAVLCALDDMYAVFPAERERYLAQYRADCLTVGKEVRLLRTGRTDTAFAEGIDEDFCLLVRYPDGRRERVSAGEVSVRGLFGYV